MAYRIRILPSAREYPAEAGETLLEAALRSGVNLDYSCSSGTCGRCRARLVEGELGTVEFHDFAFSEAEKGRGWFLPCRAHAGSDLVMEAHEASGSEDIPLQRIGARVVRLEHLPGGVGVLHLRTPRTQTLRFLAGQAVTLRLEDGSGARAAVASCPCNGMQLQFHFRPDPADPFVTALFERVGNGSTIELSGPHGHFTLDEDSPRPILMVAEDIGFAPIKSLIEHAIALDLTQPMLLLRLAGPGGHYLENLCRAWADALDNVAYRSLPAALGDYSLVRETIRRWLARHGAADAYLAGSPAFHRALASLEADRCRVLRYVATPVASVFES